MMPSSAAPPLFSFSLRSVADALRFAEYVVLTPPASDPLASSESRVHSAPLAIPVTLVIPSTRIASMTGRRSAVRDLTFFRPVSAALCRPSSAFLRFSIRPPSLTPRGERGPCPFRDRSPLFLGDHRHDADREPVCIGHIRSCEGHSGAQPTRPTTNKRGRPFIGNNGYPRLGGARSRLRRHRAGQS